jgi:hypothetical protein
MDCEPVNLTGDLPRSATAIVSISIRRRDLRRSAPSRESRRWNIA